MKVILQELWWMFVDVLSMFKAPWYVWFTMGVAVFLVFEIVRGLIRFI
jgi:hypothetical protein